jgi:hypothetical protein
MAGKKISSKGKIALGVGAGLAALAAAGAGYYFYGAKEAGKNRKKAAVWANKMKMDVIRAAKKVKKLDEKALHAIIANVESAYRKMKNVRTEDVAEAAAELRTHWKKVQAEVEKGAKRGVRVATSSANNAVRVAKKAVKKVAKKKRT